MREYSSVFLNSDAASTGVEPVALTQEKAHVAGLRAADAQAQQWNPQGHLVGLALSGGGIRSATFCLGVLQAIAQHRWLRRFDYLSTVSGGGYIGAWLSAILHRQAAGPSTGDKVQDGVQDKVQVVEQLISPRDIQSKSDEPVEIAFLRAYSNYLTPRLGLLSADTLAAVAGYLRSLTFNLLLALLTIGCVLAVLHGPVAWVMIHGANVKWSFGSLFGIVVNGISIVAAAMCAFLITLQTLDVRSALANKTNQAIAVRGLRLAQDIYGKGVLYGMLFIVALMGFQFEIQLADPHHFGWFAPIGPNTLMLFVAGIFLAYFLVEVAREIEPSIDPDHKPINISNQQFAFLALKSVVLGYRAIKDEWFRYVVAAVACNLVGDALVSAASHLPPVPFIAMVFRGPALAVALLSVMLIVWIGMVSTTYADQTREWLSRLVGVIAGFLVVWVLMGAVVINARPVWLWLNANGAAVTAPGSPHWWLAVAAAVLVVLMLMLMSERLHRVLAQRLRTLTGLLVVALTLAVATVAFQTALVHVSHISPTTLMPTALYGDYLQAHMDAVSKASAQLQLTSFSGSQWLDAPVETLFAAWPSCALLLAVAAAAVAAFRYIDVNAFSLQNLYRNRLVRCYLGAAHGKQRMAEPFTGFDPQDDIHLSALEQQRPFHIFNAALNMTQGDDLAWQQRKAASFSFTPRKSGFWLETADLSGLSNSQPVQGGYAPTSAYACETVNWQTPHSGAMLGTVMATSGAAVSSQMGFASTGLRAFVLTLFNVRLGRWFPNPALKSTPAQLKQRSPLLAAWWFLCELLGRTDERSKWVYLSDGGHFENLGIYELVRRRCKYIVAVDAGADPAMSFGDLGNAVRKCRVDFGVEVRVDLTDLTPAAAGQRPKSSSVVGTIDYPPTAIEAGFTGQILYIKLSLPTGIGTLSADVLAFAKEESAFPHQPTADQWFTESQFESYRQLGYLIGNDALQKGGGMFAGINTQGVGGLGGATALDKTLGA